LGRDEGYCVQIASSDGQPVTSESGVGLCTTPLPDPGEPIDTLVIAGGRGSRAARRDERLISWLKTVAPRCRRVTTVCTGTFVGAEAGLLDGRRVTTHWTSAGVTAGIDLALALVSEDLGVEVAQTVARWLVMFLHRPGGQTQFASPVWVRRAERSTVRAVQALVESAPGGDHRVPTLAAAAAMSVRNFTRVFSAEVGETPGKFVERVRLEAARTELETTDDTLDVIAARCGFGTAESLRRITQRHLGVAPDAYRRRFHTVPHERTHP
jgi:transcriptional regulator GlxA family with amidase domain